MFNFWKFINESEHIIKMDGLKPTNDIEKSIYDKRYNIKNNFNLFLKDIQSRRASKKDKLKLLSTRRKNEGIFAENISRLIFKGENLNHFTKNHPYVDISVIEPIDGITKENELISIKSTLEYTSPKKLLGDTKAIKFDSLLSYLVYANNLYKRTNQPFSINEIQRGLNKIFSEDLTQEQYMDILYIILEHILRYAEKWSDKTLKEFEDSLIFDVDKYLSDEMDINDIKEYVKKEINKLTFPVSLAIVFIGPNDKMPDIDPTQILNVYKTNSIKLGEFFFRVMNRWAKRNFFGERVKKYLSFDDIVDVFRTKYDDLFPTKIHIDFTDFENKSKGSSRKRLYVATELKVGYYGDYEDEVLDVIFKLIKDFEKNPEKVKDFKKFLENK